MAVPRSKRKRLLILSASLNKTLQSAFNNDEENPLIQDGLVACAGVMPQMLLESDTEWTTAQTDAYTVVDGFCTEVETEPSPNYESWVTELQRAVENL